MLINDTGVTALCQQYKGILKKFSGKVFITAASEEMTPLLDVQRV